MSPHLGFASARGTEAYAASFPINFYRIAQGLRVSTIGLGTYLGRPDEVTSRNYREAIRLALKLGINFLDTSLNYRDQLSEIAMGEALSDTFAAGEVARDGVVVCTKAGYLVQGAVPQGLAPDDVVGGMHSMTPAFLTDQLDRSIRNLGLETIDVFYLHNPETQLGFVSPDVFYARVSAAFEFLEQARSAGKIRFYGAATWDGFRRRPGGPEGLSLNRLAKLAQAIAGEGHGFRFIQLPFNLAMPEAFTIVRDGRSVIDEADDHHITVVGSASLLQSRLARNLPDELTAVFAGTSTDAQRALQFTRSTPGITVALVGMSQAAHVRENAALASIPPLGHEEYLSVYRHARQ